MRIVLLVIFLFIVNCKFNKIVDSHGSHYLEKKEKELTIKSSDISPKQWSTLLLELNLIVKAWRPYAKIELKAPGLKKVIGWGTKKYDHKD